MIYRSLGAMCYLFPMSAHLLRGLCCLSQVLLEGHVFGALHQIHEALGLEFVTPIQLGAHSPQVESREWCLVIRKQFGRDCN